MTKIEPKPINPKLLRLCCNPDDFAFSTTDDLADLDGFVGQERALTATGFGIDIKRDGYNIFALGPVGVGKRSIVLALLEKEAKKHKAPADICFVYNFKNPRNPSVLLLKPGLGKRLAEDMRQLIEILRVAIPAIFESEAYSVRIKEIQEAARKRQESAFGELEREAEKDGIAILRAPDSFMLAAIKDSQVLSEEAFEALPAKERAKKEALMKTLHEKLRAFFEQIPQWQKEQREQIKEAVKKFTLLQVGTAFNDVRAKYVDNTVIVAYLDQVEAAILENPTDFRRPKENPNGFMGGMEAGLFNRYQVNVLVDNSELKGRPIIHEDMPTFANLVGRIDYTSLFGALTTDFTLIRAGALQRANGGYLLLDALKLLSQPFAWEGLKRTLRAKEIRVENAAQVLGYMTTTTLEPEPVPLDLKVVLFGSRKIYYLLCELDPDFLELFKVGADFDEEISITPETSMLFAQLLKTLAKRHDIKPLTKNAVIAVHEYGVRLAGDIKKVSTHVRKLTDLIREADYYASLSRETVIRSADVEKALAQQVFRASRVRTRQYEAIERNTLFVQVKGDAIGQVNGLSYYELGGFAFGQPVRITARVGLGTGRIIDIEREVNLGGPIHSKGVLILTGYLNGQFARNDVISLSASLVFEQSYGGIEGDSATAAEACALLSAIAQVPLKQTMAITGSMNQHGEIQPIGGVNEKIEGFFDICEKEGLTGDQGVIMPFANIEHLMVRSDVVEAAKKKRFHIYAVRTIDEALTILTGFDAGTRDKTGTFPRNSINAKVEIALKTFAKKVHAARRSKRSPSKS